MVIAVADLTAALSYEGEHGAARWEGYGVEDLDEFRSFLQGPVADRANDAGIQADFEDDLRALAADDFATEHLEKMLRAVPRHKDWEIGEALAECILASDGSRKVLWPWAESRDRRTPKASLPGADLVGFARDTQGFVLLFGEVKTSFDKKTPPGVMNGSSGMAWQLERTATGFDIHHALLRWLSLRCATPEHRKAYKEAVGRLLKSGGEDLLIVGMLLRDTPCDERDVASRAKHLGTQLAAPTRVEVIAWYFPLPIPQWSDTCGGPP